MGVASTGPRLLGRYLLYREIASGGMASVHLGRLVGPGGFTRPVAIKRLHPQFARDPAFVKMLLDEGRLAARIQHPNVVPTLDIVTEGDEAFIVMEHVPGVSLSHLIRLSRRRGTEIPLLIGASLVAGMLQGLHAAHEAKDDQGTQLELVHRDVSPQNALVGSDGVARLIDFGIAKAMGRLQSTRNGELKGKLAYMAPEQVRGEPVTRRTDVYSAAIILWETITSHRLFEGENEAHLLSKLLTYDPPAPSTLRPEIPRSLDATVLRGLERDPARRFGSAREMAAHIQACIGVATPIEISDWLERFVGDELRERSAWVEAMEHARPDAVLDDGDVEARSQHAQAVTTVTVVGGRHHRAASQPRVGLFLRALDNDYQYLQREDCLLVARRLGLSMREAVAHNDPALQRRQIEECLREPTQVRPSVLLVNPVDEGELRGAVIEAAKAGVGWVSLNRTSDCLDELRLDFPTLPLFSVTPDQRQVGRIQGRLLRRLLPQPRRVLYVQGPATTSSARLRLAGTEQELDRTGIELVVASADWTVEGGARAAQRALESALAGGTAPAAVCAQNDGMAFGARAVLLGEAPDAGDRRPASLIVLGCDGTPSYGRRLVDEGVLTATVIIPPTAGRALQEVAAGAMFGGTMPTNVTISVEPFLPREPGHSYWQQ